MPGGPSGTARAIPLHYRGPPGGRARRRWTASGVSLSLKQMNAVADVEAATSISAPMTDQRTPLFPEGPRMVPSSVPLDLPQSGQTPPAPPPWAPVGPAPPAASRPAKGSTDTCEPSLTAARNANPRRRLPREDIHGNTAQSYAIPGRARRALASATPTDLPALAFVGQQS